MSAWISWPVVRLIGGSLIGIIALALFGAAWIAVLMADAKDRINRERGE